MFPFRSGFSCAKLAISFLVWRESLQTNCSSRKNREDSYVSWTSNYVTETKHGHKLRRPWGIRC